MEREVELPSEGDAEEEYELIPMGPIRKLERRIDEIETEKSSSNYESLIRDIFDIIKANQKVVNDVVQNTNELRDSVDKLTGRMDQTIDNMNGFMELLKEASETSLEEDVSQTIGTNIVEPLSEDMEDISEKLEKMSDNLQQSNDRMLKGLNQIHKRMGGSRKSGSSSRSGRSSSRNNRRRQ